MENHPVGIDALKRVAGKNTPEFVKTIITGIPS